MMVVSSQRCKEHLIPVVSECLSPFSCSWGSWRCIAEYLTGCAGCLSGNQWRLDKVCGHMSLYCTPESNKTLQINYTSITRKRLDMTYFLAILEQFSGSLFIFFFKKERKEVPVQGSPHSHPWIVFFACLMTIFKWKNK